MTGRIGVSLNGITVTVEHFPQRKKPVLAVQIGNASYKVASFNSEETADWFLTQMQTFFGRSLQAGEQSET